MASTHWSRRRVHWLRHLRRCHHPTGILTRDHATLEGVRCGLQPHAVAPMLVAVAAPHTAVLRLLLPVPGAPSPPQWWQRVGEPHCQRPPTSPVCHWQRDPAQAQWCCVATAMAWQQPDVHGQIGGGLWWVGVGSHHQRQHYRHHQSLCVQRMCCDVAPIETDGETTSPGRVAPSMQTPTVLGWPQQPAELRHGRTGRETTTLQVRAC